MASARPFLLLDVDGVLNPLGLSPPDHVPPGFNVHNVSGLRVLLAPQHGVWLNALAADFDLVWATSWEHDADRLIAELLGLPRGLPVITFDPAETGWTSKLADVIRSVGDRPTAWVDDALGPAEMEWARSRPAATLLIRPDHRVGLTEDHVEQLRAFAREFRIDGMRLTGR